jgi:thioredoxin 1
MSETITKISDTKFDSIILTMTNTPNMVFFSADWNSQCRIIRPILEETAEKYRSQIAFYELNIDDNPEMPMKYVVHSVPTLLTFKNGQIIDLFIGLTTRDKLREKIEKILESGALYRNMVAMTKKFAVGLGRKFGV